MSGMTEFEFAFAKPEVMPEARRADDSPLRILVLGDLSGRENRGVVEPGDDVAGRPLVSVDVDDLDGALYRFSPRLRLPLGDPAGGGLPVEFKSMEDFHPDELYRRLDVFRELESRRERLLDPATFAEAARELGAGAPPEPASPADDEPAESDADTLERLLGRPAAEPPASRVPDGEVDVSRLIRDIVAPHVVPDPDPRQEQLVGSVEAAISDGLRRILGHPALKSLEATWRGLDWLVRSVETGEDLSIHVLDVSKEELAADLGGAVDDLSRSGLHRLLVEQGPAVPGGQPWSLLVGAYSFGPSPADVSLLAGLGAIASRAGGPFLASAAPSTLGCRSALELADPASWSGLGEAGTLWEALRASSAAPWIGLALPRVLLRLPYGAATDEIDSFPFEEIPEAGDHDAHLWGNAAFGIAILIAEAFTEEGWSMQPGSRVDLGDLPSYARVVDGESVLVPCAEVLTGERAADAILSRGPMPVLSIKGLPAVRVPRFQSIAAPPRALAGPWA